MFISHIFISEPLKGDAASDQTRKSLIAVALGIVLVAAITMYTTTK